MEDFRAKLLGWLDEALPPHLRESKKDEAVKFGAEKWSQLKGWFDVALKPAVEKIDEVSPPEKRPEFIRQLGVTVMVLAVVCMIMYRCGGRRGRMMRGPGRNRRMPRAAFEASPRSYFQNLRADNI